MDFPTSDTSTETNYFSRREAMSGIGMVGLGLLATSTLASGLTSQKSLGATPKVNVQTKALASKPTATQVAGFPEDWVRLQGAALPEYAKYLSKLQLKSISPRQVLEAHAKCKGTVWNSLPPKSWWTRMGYTLRVADRIALEMGVRQVEIVSAYRSPVYNSNCDGARSRSWHQANVAVDVKFPVAASRVTATARNLRDRGLFKGGVGGYESFTHIDTRGENINW